jgi:hypothetical protein
MTLHLGGEECQLLGIKNCDVLQGTPLGHGDRLQVVSLFNP